MRRRLTTGTLAPALACFLFLLPRASFGQTGSLALSSGTAAANGTISLNLNMTSPSGSEPSSIQWTLTYPAANVASISATLGSAAGSAGKTLTCAAGSGAYTCLIYGLNSSMIPNGVAAVVNLTMGTGVTTTSIGITGAVASSGAGNPSALAATGGTITGGATAPPSLSSLSCTLSTLTSAGRSTCTVTLSAPAPAGGTTVSVSSTNPLLPVAGSVIVPAAATSATFTAAAGSIPSSQNATITATLNGVSKTASISLTASVTLSALACNPAGLMSGATAACTVTLSQAVTADTAVSLSSNSPLITIPPSVTVSAGTATAQFNAATGIVTGDASGVITASLNSITQSATLTLWSTPMLTSLTCSPTLLSAGSSSTCTLTLSKSAGSVPVNLSTSDPAAIVLPAAVTVQTGSSMAIFTVKAQTAGIWLTLTATLNGISQTVVFGISTSPASSSTQASPAVLRSIFCSPKSVTRDSFAICRF